MSWARGDGCDNDYDYGGVNDHVAVNVNVNVNDYVNVNVNDYVDDYVNDCRKQNGRASARPFRTTT